MKVRLLKITVLLLMMEGVLCAQAQVYQTAQQVSATGTNNTYTGIYPSSSISTTPTNDYVGAVNPYANTKFSSTAVTPSSYTISVSALDMASVGEAQDPFRSPGIMKAPPRPGDVVKDPIGDVSGGVPVGDGTWVLLLCLVLCLSLRAYQVHRTKRV